MDDMDADMDADMDDNTTRWTEYDCIGSLANEPKNISNPTAGRN